MIRKVQGTRHLTIKTRTAAVYLCSVLCREPTRDEIIGKVDISKTKKRKAK